METRRLIMAVLLSVLILVVWQQIFPPAPPVQPAPTGEVGAEGPSSGDADVGSASVESEGDPGSSPPSGSSAETAAPAPAVEIPLEIVAAERRETIDIEVPNGHAVFSNEGAQLLSYTLTRHQTGEGSDLDLVRARGDDLYPFSLVYPDRGSDLNSALFVWEEGTADDGRQELRFRHASEAGSAEKIFRWNEQGFMDVEIRVAGDSGWGLVLGPGINNEVTRSSYGQRVDKGIGYLQGGETETIQNDDLEEDASISPVGLEWVTIEDNFFLVAAMPRAGLREVVVRPILQREEILEGRPRFLAIDTASQEKELEPEQLLILTAESDSLELTTYFGAKRYSFLSGQPHGLERTIRWGNYLGVIAKPLYLLLEWLYANVIANYGWAIVLTTLVLRLLFFPLTHKSQKSMSKMQELNPKVQAIRSKYRSKLRDKQGRPNMEAQQQMNQEVMAVYKTAGVNPASGCLPVLLQMPVFFAFFRLLTTAVELRGAPWLGWIQDLSQPDPYYLLPLVMGASSLAMQKMMPSSPDPMQKRIMQIMPIAFTAFAFAFPSGLVLYWMTNNILTMAQQYLINQMKAREQAAS